jgi:hypothetical protein
MAANGSLSLGRVNGGSRKMGLPRSDRRDWQHGDAAIVAGGQFDGCRPYEWRLSLWRGAQFRVTLPDGFATVRRCTCSYCRMRGAIAVSAKRDDLEIMAGSADSLTLYQFGSVTAKL